jgi:hypothetical protein
MRHQKTGLNTQYPSIKIVVVRCGNCCSMLVSFYRKSANPNCRKCHLLQYPRDVEKPAADYLNKRGDRKMRFIRNDGGRAAAGYKGKAGDCVCRAIAIVSGLPYEDIYRELAMGTGAQRATRKRGKRAASARNGINTRRKWFKDYMRQLGFVWTPTMRVGTGCKVHLRAGELPPGRLIVAVSRHYTAVIDGVLQDTHDCSRGGMRCVYGYWRQA